jgi:signal transduction histidine kinase
LTAAKMMLEFIPIKDHEMAVYTEKIQHIVSAAVEEVNKMCNDINPGDLNHVSLLLLIEDLVYRTNREKPVKVVIDKSGFKGNKSRNSELELTFLRFIQDILHRITHLSKSTHCLLTLADQDGKLTGVLDCDDNTFDLQGLSKNLKVVNLSNRFEHYGGSFKMEKQKKRVVFTGSLPLN